MKDSWLKITLEEPLLLGGVKGGVGFLDTLNYVPGRILRGAWAEWLVAQGREKEIPETVGQVSLWNFFPAAEWRHVVYVSPFLLSTLTCKTEPGFISEPNPRKRGHGVVDTALPHVAYLLLREAGASLSLPFAVACGCGGRTADCDGFYAVYRDGQHERCVWVRQDYHTQTRVALSRQRRAAREGMLYTVTALSPYVKGPEDKGNARQVFLGRVSGTSDLVGEMVQALNIMPIGALRTRGYGKIKIEPSEIVGFPPLALRLEQFNQKLAILWGDLGRLAAGATQLPARPPGIYFSVDLLAPGIFRQRGQPVLFPTLEFGGRVLEPLLRFTRPAFVGGWSTAWGLPKPTELAARMGSVYLFRWNGSREELLPWLERLEGEGVGERRDEGFGECIVCHPLHQEVDER